MKIEILEVSGESCANCLTLLPVLKKIAEEKHLLLRHLEVNEANLREVQALEVERVPTVILLKDGTPFARCTGFQPEEILEVWIEAKIQEITREV